ncbi:MAG TPA: TlpA family protein disulfide reductase, partial [Pyrinomonadaceae bacterium]|nr:TlpA family protein disulfide reductase [Pyrinomonadaceae bacterium]
MIQLKSIVRQPTAFAAGFAVILVFGFAALAQTPSDSAAKQDGSVAAIFGNLARVKPRDCWHPDRNLTDRLVIDKKLIKKPSATPNFMSPIFQAQPALPNTEDIRVIDLEGLKKVLQRDPNDKRPLLLNFWATWCDPCREEFPDLVKLDADYKDKPLNFVAVSLDDITDIKSEVPKFLNQMKATMPVVLLNVKDPEPAIKIVDPTWDGQ